MGKDANQVQTQYKACRLAVDREKSYAVFVSEDWRSPFMQYLIEGVSCHKGTVKDTSLGGNALLFA